MGDLYSRINSSLGKSEQFYSYGFFCINLSLIWLYHIFLFNYDAQEGGVSLGMLTRKQGYEPMVFKL